jgi:hypothetical protein
MNISIHQPEHLPWLGFFHKISLVEVFVLLDIVQYRKQYFQNRNRLRTSNGFIMVTVPVISKNRRDQFIKDVEIDWTDRYWPQRIWESIKHNYNKAPYFGKYGEELRAIYCDTLWNRLADLNITLIKKLSDMLGIKTNFIIASNLNETGKSTDLIIAICQKLNAKLYLSGRFGKNYLEETKFDQAGVELKYHNFYHPIYKQVYDPFLPEMSVIDLLMCHGKDSLKILTTGQEKLE